MNRFPTIIVLLTLATRASGPAVTPAAGQVTGELDAFWTELARTVEEGDFAGYAALYHDDAVLVSEFSDASQPIAEALAGWEQGFLDTQTGSANATVQFRFSRRLNDATTAHETGIFHYRFAPGSGQISDQYVHFEALLVKKGTWRMVMEFQKSRATLAEWAALERASGQR